jgi:hypothetical protein
VRTIGSQRTTVVRADSIRLVRMESERTTRPIRLAALRTSFGVRRNQNTDGTRVYSSGRKDEIASPTKTGSTGGLLPLSHGPP